ncbi:hypothetical protein QKW52_00045 [Bacillus sonorensis]|nr:hypothetical protein [Bacillus sonorensis]
MLTKLLTKKEAVVIGKVKIDLHRKDREFEVAYALDNAEGSKRCSPIIRSSSAANDSENTKLPKFCSICTTRLSLRI